MIMPKDLVRSYLFSHGLETNYTCMKYFFDCIDTLKALVLTRRSGGKHKATNLCISGSSISNIWNNWPIKLKSQLIMVTGFF